MANNIFTNQLNNRELMDAFGIQQDNAPLTPEQLVALSEQQQAPAVEEIAEPVQAPIKTATQPTLKKAQVEQSMEPSDSGISKAMDALKNWENRPKEEASSISQTQTTEAPMSKSEALIAEYNKLLGKGQEDLAEARKRDRMLKVGGALGDALATYLNARSQMNVKAPGVQVQQGAGLGKIADMFATAPEIASDVAQRREAMMKQYAELAKGERSQAKLTSEEKKAKSAQELTKELAEEKNKTMLQAARIKASKKSEEKEKQPSFEQKERIKADVKQESKIAEENRKLKSQLEPAIATVDDQIKNVKDAISLINKSRIAGTGPLDQFFAGATPEGQLLKKALGNIQLDTLVTKFQGMSRAVDTETDRKFFQETQPSMGNFETTNKKMLNDILTRLEGIKERSEKKLKEINSQKKPESTTVKTTNTSQTSNLVRIKGPSGQEATMTEENAQKYLNKPGYIRLE